MREPKLIIKTVEECGEILQLEDGFYHYAPRGGGGIPSWVLRVIADYLDDQNAVWNEVCKYAGEPARLPSQMWQNGMERIDALIVKLLDAGWTIAGVDDGGDELCSCETRRDAIPFIASVAQSTIYFERNGLRSWVLVIPANGDDVLCDHSTKDEAFVAQMDTVML